MISLSLAWQHKFECQLTGGLVSVVRGAWWVAALNDRTKAVMDAWFQHQHMTFHCKIIIIESIAAQYYALSIIMNVAYNLLSSIKYICINFVLL